MTTQRLTYLYQQYQLKQLTPAETAEWEQAVADQSNDQTLLSLIDPDWNLQDFKAPVLNNEQETIYNYVVAQPQYRQIRTKLWPRVGIAAAVAAMIISAGLYFIKPAEQQNTPNQTVQQDVAPGKQGATLTLASGKKIRLSDAANGELAKEAGVTIRKSADGQLVYEIKEASDASRQINTLSTAKGETYQVRLPDGSLVALNAASSLTYSANLRERGKRRVRLEGEGYFEVAKDKLHPFVVETKGQEVEVLGTHFNVNAYPDERAVKTTLLEGGVKVSASNTKTVILKPGEQAENVKGKLTVSIADRELAVAWKNNKFMFDAQNITEIMRMVERWYNVQIIYNGEIPDNKFSGSVNKYEQVSEVLKTLESTAKVHFEIKGRTIYVRK